MVRDELVLDVVAFIDVMVGPYMLLATKRFLET